MIPAADARGRVRDVVTLGEVMALYLAEPGTPLDEAARFRRTLAGAEFNSAIALARLGARVCWIGRIGDDSAGRSALARLRAEGVDTCAVTVDPDRPTGALVRDCHAARPISVEYHRRGSAGSRLEATDVDEHLIAQSRAVLLSGITPLLSPSARAAQEMALAAAERHQCCVVFDPNVRRKLASPARAASALRPMAARAHIVLAGLDEAQLLSGRDDRDAAAGWFLDRAAHLVVLKDGAAGAWATDGTTTWTQPAYPVPVVDPVGAGDAFNSGLLAALLRGADVDVAMHEAAAVAALVVTTAGDIEGLPRSEAELTRFRAAEAVQR